jgi:hypothetical protein
MDVLVHGEPLPATGEPSSLRALARERVASRADRRLLRSFARDETYDSISSAPASPSSSVSPV